MRRDVIAIVIGFVFVGFVLGFFAAIELHAIDPPQMQAPCR